MSGGIIRAGTVARMLDLHRDTARKKIKAGLYGRAFFIDGEWAVSREDLERWLESCRVAVAVPGGLSARSFSNFRVVGAKGGERAA
jgi:hypothetical protein